MSFGGHVLDMINRIQYNESLKSKRRESYKKIRKIYNEELLRKYQFADKTDINKKYLEQLKNKIKTRIKKRQQKRFFISLIITLLIVSFLLIIIFKSTVNII